MVACSKSRQHVAGREQPLHTMPAWRAAAPSQPTASCPRTASTANPVAHLVGCVELVIHKPRDDAGLAHRLHG